MSKAFGNIIYLKTITASSTYDVCFNRKNKNNMKNQKKEKSTTIEKYFEMLTEKSE